MDPIVTIAALLGLTFAGVATDVLEPSTQDARGASSVSNSSDILAVYKKRARMHRHRAPRKSDPSLLPAVGGAWG